MTCRGARARDRALGRARDGAAASARGQRGLAQAVGIVVCDEASAATRA
jgi:hypothetical protein